MRFILLVTGAAAFLGMMERGNSVHSQLQGAPVIKPIGTYLLPKLEGDGQYTVNWVGFAAQGKQIVAHCGHAEKAVCFVWDRKTSQLVKSHDCGKDRYENRMGKAAAINKQESELIYADDKGIMSLAIDSGTKVVMPCPNRSFALSPCSTTLHVAEVNKKISRVMYSYKTHDLWVDRLDVRGKSPDLTTTTYRLPSVTSVAIDEATLVWSEEKNINQGAVVHIVSLLTGAEAKIISPANAANIAKLEISPDGKCIAVGRVDGAVSIYDLKTRAELGAFHNASRTISSFAFSSDMRILAVGSYDMKRDNVFLYSLAEKKILRTWQDAQSAVSAVQLDSTGSLLIVGTASSCKLYSFNFKLIE